MKKSTKTNIFTLIIIIVLVLIIALLVALPDKKENKKNVANNTSVTPTLTPSSTDITPTVTPEPEDDTEEEDANGGPIFSLKDYLYSENQVLTISIPNNRAGKIVYTDDGSEPTKTSALYPSSGIKLTAGDKQLVKEMESFYKYPHEESWDIYGYTIKAKIFYDDGTESPTTVHSYFLNKNIFSRYKTYVLSISGEYEDLTHTKTGILAGASNNRGKDSEITACAEFITSDGNLIFNQYIGMRPYGGASRGADIKSFKMYARKDAGSNKGKFTIPGEIFGTERADGSLIESYEHLVVRAGGNDMNFGFLRDELNQTLMRQAGYPVTEGTVPVVVYVNGNYYGLLWLHENYCDEYFKELSPNENAKSKFVVLEGSETSKTAGSDPNDYEKAGLEDYKSLYESFANSDLTDDETYNTLTEFIDVENYLDYYAFNIYIANNDWPNNNYKCYRYMFDNSVAAGEGIYDGRWRYLPHDMDFGQYLYHDKDKPHSSDDSTGAANNSVARICDPKDKKYSPLFAALMQRKDCREYFIGRIINLGNTVLSQENVSAVMKTITPNLKKELNVYLPVIRKISRNEWWPSMDSVNDNHKFIDNFHKERLEYLLTYFEEDYGYTRDELLKMERDFTNK